MSGGTLQADQTLTLNGASVGGGFLIGNFVATNNAVINGSTTYNTTTVNHTGSTFASNFTNGGHFTNGAYLSWNGGTNAASGTFDVNNTATVFNFANAGVMNVTGTLSNSSGDLTLARGSRTYVGSAASPGGAISFYTGKVQLNGTLLVNNGTIYGDVAVNYGSLYEGSGRAGNIVVGAGGTVHPGNSPGALISSSATWSGGGTLQVDFANATGTPGTGWSVWNVTGPLTVNATPSDVFTISVAGLEQMGSGGDAPIFDPSQNYSWVLAASTGVTGFAPSDFQLNFTGFTTPVNGTFTVVSDGKSIALDYTAGAAAVPEPASLAGIALCSAGLLLRRRRGSASSAW